MALYNVVTSSTTKSLIYKCDSRTNHNGREFHQFAGSKRKGTSVRKGMNQCLSNKTSVNEQSHSSIMAKSIRSKDRTLRSPVRKLRTQKSFRRLSHVERPNQKQRFGRILLTLKSSKNNLSKVKKAA